MPLNKLQFKPGINTELTAYANEGGWLDSDKVRFRFGYPEKIGGWTKYSTNSFLGSCYSLHNWRALDNSEYLSVGTNLKFYIEEGLSFYDVTPIRATTVGAATFSATSGSATLTVTDIGHGALAGDFVTFSGAVTLGGVITAPVLNIEYAIVSVINSNSYTVTSTVSANGSDTGNGGVSVTAAYQINVGIDTVVPGNGWGAGFFGRGTWGSGATTVAGGESLRIWSQDNFGEDLLFCIRDGATYYWDKTNGVSTRAVTLASISSSAPTIARQVAISDRDRHAIAFGCNPLGGSVQDKLLIRFSDQENLTDWEPTATNTAGDLIVGTGSEIVTAVETRREIVVFTDASVHSLQYLGPPFTFGISQVSLGTTIAGAKSAAAVNDSVIWMGKDRFYVYEGQVQTLPCTVLDTVFDSFNYTQSDKVEASVNSKFNEITWFYPSASSETNDKYVTFNYQEKVWYYGSLARTAWLDRSIKEYPLAASTDGYLYNQEKGVDADGQPLSAYIESSPVDIQDGENFAFIRRLLPDIDFLDSSSGADKEVTFTLKTEDFPGTGYTQSYASSVTENATQNHVRIRGRSVGLRLESSNLGVTWRLGNPRIDIRQDGRR
jgi:hypothetical protein